LYPLQKILQIFQSYIKIEKHKLVHNTLFFVAFLPLIQPPHSYQQKKQRHFSIDIDNELKIDVIVSPSSQKKRSVTDDSISLRFRDRKKTVKVNINNLLVVGK
jgi:hypothetical protein